MDIPNLLNYYNTLFGIEIALFGVISAIIMVFIQLMYGNYSYKHVSPILSNKWLMLYFLFSILDLLLTSAGSYFLLLGRHDFIPSIYFMVDLTIMNPMYLFLCLFLIFSSVSIFIIFLVKNLSFLQPHRAIFLLLRGISYAQIRNFLWKKYDLEPPYNLRIRLEGTILDAIENPDESTEAREARLREQYQEEDNELKRIDKEIQIIRKKVSNAEDPLLPIRDMVIQFLKKSDLSSLEESCILIEKVTDNFLKSVSLKDSKWKPENELPLRYIQHLIELFKTEIEIATKENLKSAELIIIRSSYNIALNLLSNNKFNELDKIQDFWQEVADTSIGTSREMFKSIINYYRHIAEQYFEMIEDKTKKMSEEQERHIENVFHHIGWLGGKLLIKQPIEEEPLFSNYEYSSEYDDYYNCLLTFSHIYDRDQPYAYPLIYFDALRVVVRRLINIYKKDKESNLKDNIYSIAYAFASFAENAIKVNNGNGASLAAIRLKETYEDLKQAGFNKEANDVIRLLVRVGMLSAGHTFDRTLFMSKSFDNWVIDELVESNEDISSEVFESYIKTIEGDHTARWDFITRLGMRMGTNFGLMFDATTGQLYADDDPRRR